MACRVLGVSRTGYHASLVRPESGRAKADRALTALVVASHAASRRTYGAPRVLDDLRDLGYRVGQRRVARLMRQAGLRGAFHPHRASHVGRPVLSDIRFRVLIAGPSAGVLRRPVESGAYVSGPLLSSLVEAGAVRSLSRPGTPLDNAVIESFFSTLERELLARERYATRVEAQSSLLDYIEIFYNRQRKHSTLGYLSPATFEARSSTPGGVSTEAT